MPTDTEINVYMNLERETETETDREREIPDNSTTSPSFWLQLCVSSMALSKETCALIVVLYQGDKGGMGINLGCLY